MMEIYIQMYNILYETRQMTAECNAVENDAIGLVALINVIN